MKRHTEWSPGQSQTQGLWALCEIGISFSWHFIVFTNQEEFLSDVDMIGQTIGYMIQLNL